MLTGGGLRGLNYLLGALCQGYNPPPLDSAKKQQPGGIRRVVDLKPLGEGEAAGQ
jgi:hypothetical protein